MILLDTCTVIWDVLDSSKLSATATTALNDADNDLIMCDIPIWEIAMLIQKNRLIVDSTASKFIDLVLQVRNFRIQEIILPIAELSINFGQEINNDPADRLISATSILFNVPLVTADQNLRYFPLVDTIW